MSLNRRELLRGAVVSAPFGRPQDALSLFPAKCPPASNQPVAAMGRTKIHPSPSAGRARPTTNRAKTMSKSLVLTAVLLAAPFATAWAQQPQSPMQPGQMQPGQMQPGQMQAGQMQPGQMQPGQMPGGMMGMMGMMPGGMMGAMMPGGMMEMMHMMRPGMMPMMVIMLDTDGDGGVSLEEYQAVHQRIFRAMDADGDGRLTASELQGQQPQQQPAASDPHHPQ